MGGVPMVSKSVLQEQMAKQEYKYGFVADLDEDTVPKGLSEDVVRLISRKKKEPEWMTEWRLRAYRHWLTMKEPTWSNVRYPPIDYQNIIYYAAPKPKKEVKSLEDVDPEIRALYAKLGIPLQEQERLAGVAVDAVLDSVSVATTFKDKLADLGIIFCSFSEAVLEHPELVRKYLGSVVPFNDNFFAALNSAVFSDGSFAYVPSGVRCPMELSTYFRINAMDTGQFERTLIIADPGAYVSYLEGCTAPIRDTNQLHGGRRTDRPRRCGDQILDDPELVSRRQAGEGRDLQLRHEARQVPRRELEDLVDPGRDRLVDYLEVSELHPPGRQLPGRVLLRRGRQQLPAGRHRHEDAPYREEHEV